MNLVQADGSFINSIKCICDNTMFYDIMPEHSEIVKQDYLKTDLISQFNRKIHVIGNPPTWETVVFGH